MKKIITAMIVGFLAFGLFAGSVSAEINAVTPSTNDINRTNGWAHVDQTSVGVGEVTLNFIQPRGFAACFEYRTDGNTDQRLMSGGVYRNNYNSKVTDGLYPFYCQNNNSSTHTINANEYVEVRMVFGAEADERFDWTRFDVQTAPTTPVVLGFLSPTLACGALTNIHSTTVDWTDSTGGVGGIIGYDYEVDYPLPGGGVGHWSTFVASSQRSGSLNEGLHTVRVRAKDSAGNYSEWSNSCSLTTDWTAPDVSLTNPLVGTTVFGNVDVRGTITDLHPHHYWLVIEDSSNHTIAGPGVVNDTTSFTDKSLFNWNTTLVPDGVYTVKLEARDSANNKDAGSVDWNIVTVNNTPDDKDQCKNGGWESFTKPAFKNQGQCVSYIVSNENAGKRE